MTNIDDITIDPFENIPDLAGGSWAQHVIPKGNDKNNGRKHTIIAPFNGTVVRCGGVYNQIVLKSKRGKFMRLAENATLAPNIKPGYEFKIFEPIAFDALYRQGQYKGTHVNGGDENTRYPYSNDVTHTQEQARAIIAQANAPKPPANTTSVTIVPGSNANLRSRPVAKTETFIKSLKANTIHPVIGYVYGEVNNNNALWYVLSVGADGYPDTFLWSGITTTLNPIGLTQLQERPTLPEPEIVVPPVDENNGGEEEPIITEPINPDDGEDNTPDTSAPTTPAHPHVPVPNNPEKEENMTNPNVTPSSIDKLTTAIANVLFLTLPVDVRKRVYKASANVGAIGSAVGIAGLATAAVIGGKIGATILVASGSVTLVSTALTALASKLAEKNT